VGWAKQPGTAINDCTASRNFAHAFARRGSDTEIEGCKRLTEFAFSQVDVFTSQPLRGNPLAVVVGADALTDAQMAALANWTNLSETTFLLRPTNPLADYRVRIFTPYSELPFAGHPTLGSCHVWLTCGGAPKGDEVVQECKIGLVRIRRGPGRLSFAAPKMLRSGPLEADIMAQAVKGLGLVTDAVIASSWVDNGPGWLGLLLRSRDEVLAARPDYTVLSGLSVGVVGPWDHTKDGHDAQFEVRAFTGGGYEDPVTGSLNASLAQWLIGTGVAPPNYVASQGTALGRMGRVHVEQDGSEIWIGGAVTTCIAGTLTL
jgi:PhzF family phenazine biosynthesis protein